MKLIGGLKLSAPEYGIEILDHGAETYSPQASWFSDKSDIMLAQEPAAEKRPLLYKKEGMDPKRRLAFTSTG